MQYRRLSPFLRGPDGLHLLCGLSVQSSNELRLEYQFKDPQKLALGWSVSNSHPKPVRANELWRKTCFELFWAVDEESTAYFELNVNLNGEWSVYEFSKYRNPTPPQACPTYSVREIQATPESLSVTLDGHFLNASDWFYNPTCIVHTIQDQILYYAVHHGPAPKPDFHLRENLQKWSF